MKTTTPKPRAGAKQKKAWRDCIDELKVMRDKADNFSELDMICRAIEVVRKHASSPATRRVKGCASITCDVAGNQKGKRK